MMSKKNNYDFMTENDWKEIRETSDNKLRKALQVHAGKHGPVETFRALSLYSAKSVKDLSPKEYPKAFAYFCGVEI